MVQVVAHQYQHRDIAPFHEVPVHVEDEVTVVHVGTEPGEVVFADIVPVLEVVRPAVEHLVERLAILVEADGLLQHRCRHSFGLTLHQAEAVGTADAAAEDMAFFDVEVIQQVDMVLCIGVPAVIGGHRCRGATGIALVHGNHLEVGG